jgi:hypothetical protein
LPENNIAKQCLQLSKEMADKNQTGLMQKIDQLCIKYNSSSITLDVNNEKRFTSHIKQNIGKALTAHQLKLIDTNRKLNFYASFRKDTKKTGSLDVINNPHHRIAINKFRLGNHKLRIETGRHTIPKTPINLRICSFCHSNEVENEIHFLFSCQLYDSLRLKFFNEITKQI